LARFRWLQYEIRRLGFSYESVIELGCFDGKLIEFLPWQPKRYVGFDSNWEGGLDLALQKWQQFPQYSFVKACVPEDMSLEEGDSFDIAVIMETLEHVVPESVDDYLRKIEEHTKGYVFITVPNEKGIVFLVKWLAKKLLFKDARQYSLPELFNATLGRMHKVKRFQHKGFDYSALVREVEHHFELVRVSGHPMGFLPTWLCFGVGIVGRTRSDSAA